MRKQHIPTPDGDAPKPTFFKRQPDPLGYDVSNFNQFAVQIADDAISGRHQKEIDAEVQSSLALNFDLVIGL